MMAKSSDQTIFLSDSPSLIRRKKPLPKSSGLIRNRESDDGNAINSRKWATRRIFPAERRLSDEKSRLTVHFGRSG